ncbi:hypothetical protein A2707_03490 [Candidatus Saccharibacteria bacterium RIFCSPHIGHO2_01_FULL_45_15]|nr:MAG: hypothetical protein A2707_03490 [Candidatus Saccharibacteria bacterium RIFCSPHIGHO2_01_FULL_45_15]OGL28582.1 MAG: hypothetical protein A3C39_03040 [Candidatus Saccharibacteria bacterium RIFCSPHIGHO2_02_FULL_46_12]OGL32439.1 MAG: hypothetical protein A3E76_00075 [Candidatus Saccharibacteria bacterium RIFCSPHIGHO2_12_FULL_44_22]
MQNRQFHKFIYNVQHRYMTMNNVVVVIAAAIAVSWAWASIGVVQKNYALQRQVDDKNREKQLVQLQTENLAYEQRYYKSDEYLSLEVRSRMGLGDPGEKVLVLPKNTAAAKADQSAAQAVTQSTTVAAEPAEIQQWANFLFGGNDAQIRQ